MLESYNMKGGGFYNQHSTPQRQTIDQVLPWLLEALQDLPADCLRGTVRTLDIGCSEGANAIYAQKQIIDRLADLGAQWVQPTFADLPSNDFNQVLANLFPGGDASLGERALPALIGGSAFERLAPDASLHVATTYNMLGFRAHPPKLPLRNTIGAICPTPYGPTPEPTPDPAEIAASHAEAKPDLVAFYRARAAELVLGGKLLTQSFGCNNSGGSVAHGWIDAINDTLREFIDKGSLPATFIDDFTFPAVWRNLTELMAPLEEEDDLRGAFRIERAESLEAPVSFNQAFQETGDAKAWASEFNGMFRAVTEPIITHALPESCLHLVDDIYSGIERRMASDPQRYQFHFYHNAVLLTRK